MADLQPQARLVLLSLAGVLRVLSCYPWSIVYLTMALE